MPNAEFAHIDADVSVQNRKRGLPFGGGDLSTLNKTCSYRQLCPRARARDTEPLLLAGCGDIRSCRLPRRKKRPLNRARRRIGLLAPYRGSAQLPGPCGRKSGGDHWRPPCCRFSKGTSPIVKRTLTAMERIGWI